MLQARNILWYEDTPCYMLKIVSMVNGELIAINDMCGGGGNEMEKLSD